MARALLVAEKPDLQRQIFAVYEKHRSEIPHEITMTSQRGHLVTLMLPDEIDENQKKWIWENIPFEPENSGGWKYKVITEKKQGNFLTSQERYKAIEKEIKSGNYDFIIHAGDPDQEGELLVNLVLKMAGNKLPVMRFWTNDLTESHILNALQNLKNDDTDPMLTNLLSAAYGRQHSDYRFGMNVSRAATLKMSARVACGRVKTPILAIVCKREEEIRNFKAKTVYGVKAQYDVGFAGSLFNKNEIDESDKDEDKKQGIVWFETADEAREVINSIGDNGKVAEYESKEVSQYAPKLFKLATLQIEAGKLGYNDGYTLQIIQQLYEKKLLSYPRTDCEFLSSNEDFYGILCSVLNVPEFKPYIQNISRQDIERVRHTKKWINDKALEESGHSAIRPTTEVADFSSLSEDERVIYSLVCRRFVAMFMKPLIQKKTKLIVDIDGKTFVSNGSSVVDPGYSVIFGTKFTDVVIPEYKEGDSIHVDEFSVSEKTSKCPKRYTSPDLIAVCEAPAKFLEDKSLKELGERLKIGTPATRSSIISQLISDKYMATKTEGKKEYVYPTELGMAIIRNLGPCEICKVDMTGRWEEKLEDIRLGKMSLDSFEEEMRQEVRDMVADIKRTPMTPFSFRSATKVVGTCPLCKNEIIESEKGFSCKGYKKDGSGCNVKLWKNKWNATFTYDDFVKLIDQKGTIEKEITVSLRTWKQLIRYNFETYDVEYVEEKGNPLIKCPYCSGTIYASDRTFRCDSCGMTVQRSFVGAEITDDQFKALIEGNKITITCKKESKSWEQPVVFNSETKRIDFFKNVSNYKCPCCKKSPYLSETEKNLKCEECGFTIWKVMAGVTLSDESITKLIMEGSTDMIKGFKSKKGSSFDAKVKVNKRKKAVEFEFKDKK